MPHHRATPRATTRRQASRRSPRLRFTPGIRAVARAKTLAPESGIDGTIRLFWRVAARLRRLAEIRFAQFGLTPVQWSALRTLHRARQAGRADLTSTDLRTELLLSKAAVSGLIDRMARQHLIQRVPSREDHRSQYLRLTHHGLATMEQVLPSQPDWIGSLLRGLNAADRKILARLLQRLGDSLGSRLQDAGVDVPPLEVAAPSPETNP